MIHREVSKRVKQLQGSVVQQEASFKVCRRGGSPAVLMAGGTPTCASQAAPQAVCRSCHGAAVETHPCSRVPSALCVPTNVRTQGEVDVVEGSSETVRAAFRGLEARMNRLTQVSTRIGDRLQVSPAPLFLLFLHKLVLMPRVCALLTLVCAKPSPARSCPVTPAAAQALMPRALPCIPERRPAAHQGAGAGCCAGAPAVLQ